MFFLMGYFFPFYISHHKLTLFVNYQEPALNKQYLKERNGELQMKFRLTLALYLTNLFISLILALLDNKLQFFEDEKIFIITLTLTLIIIMIIEGKYSNQLRQFYFQDIILLIYFFCINLRLIYPFFSDQLQDSLLITSYFNLFIMHFTLDSIYQLICKMIIILIAAFIIICFEITYFSGYAISLEITLLVYFVYQYQKEVYNKLNFANNYTTNNKKVQYNKLLESLTEYQLIALQHCECGNSIIKSRFPFGSPSRFDQVEVSIPDEEFDFEIYYRNENSLVEFADDTVLLNQLANIKITNNEDLSQNKLSSIILNLFSRFKNSKSQTSQEYFGLLAKFEDYNGMYLSDSRQSSPRISPIKNGLLPKQYEIKVAPCLWDEQLTILILLKEIQPQLFGSQLTRCPSQKTISGGQLGKHIFQSVSHELKTPLNGMYLQVQSCLSIIKQEMKRCDVVREIIEILQDVQHNNFILQSKVNDLLDFKGLEIGKFQINRSEFDLQNTLDDLKELFQRQFKEKGVNFKIECDSNPTILYTDEARLRQILINFIGNSLKFTFSGFVSLDVKTQEQNLIEFIITDTGIGIPHEFSEHLFQLTSGASSKQHGAGLGLTICKQLVGVLGPKQEIKMKSTFQQGTTFQFSIFKTLFRNRESQQFFIPSERRGKKKILSIQIKHSDHLIATGSNKDIITYTNIKQEHQYQILIVDDTSINIMALRCLFDRIFTLPHKIDEAYNGIQAVEKVQQQCYHIIFMDINMPLMDGLEATKIIREIEVAQNRKSSTIIVVTAYSDNSVQQTSIDNGANKHIVKPITQDQILSLLKDITNQQ